MAASSGGMRFGCPGIAIAYCLGMWAHDVSFFLIRDGRIDVISGDAWVILLAPVLGVVRDLVLLARAISGNFREWPGDFTFVIPWFVALATFGLVIRWFVRRGQCQGADADDHD